MKIIQHLSSKLSYKLLGITIGLILCAQMLILIPAAGRFREDWLRQNLAMAETSAMLMHVITPDDLTDKEWRQIFNALNFYNIDVKKDGRNVYIALNEGIPSLPAIREQIKHSSNFNDIRDVFGTIYHKGQRIVRASGKSTFSGSIIEIEFHEKKLYEDIVEYILETLLTTLMLSIMVGGLLYIILVRIFIRPLKRLTIEMAEYSANPVAFSHIPSSYYRIDEIGTLSKEFSILKGKIDIALKANESLATLGLAVAKISHDLRNVLTAAQLISDRIALNSDAKTADYSKRLVSTIDRAVDLCQSTLFYGKLDTLKLNKSKFAFHKLAHEISETLQISDNNTPIALNFEYKQNLTLYADREHLFRVLLNLCRNAQQALIECKSIQTPYIHIHAQQMEDLIIIDVIDNGPGIPRHLQNGLFKPFQSSANAGTGLGLAIAKDLIEAHEGTIKLLNTECGTHFKISLINIVK